MEYYKSAVVDKNNEIRMGIVYNLPCFYFTFKNDEQAKAYFDQNYLDLSKDSNPEILKLVSAGIHELISLQDHSLGPFKDILKSLLQHSSFKQV